MSAWRLHDNERTIFCTGLREILGDDLETSETPAVRETSEEVCGSPAESTYVILKQSLFCFQYARILIHLHLVAKIFFQSRTFFLLFNKIFIVYSQCSLKQSIV